MTQQVLIAHAPGDETLAEKLAEPVRRAGYDVLHIGTVLVGESVVEEYSRALQYGNPVVLCGTIQACGTRWAGRVVGAARAAHAGVRVFPVQMEPDADVERLALDDTIARYW